MKTISLNLYSYDELSDKAKERALNDWNKYNDDPLLQSHMINLLGEKLEENNIETESDPNVLYSLAHCQGDGFMFEGSFTFKGNRVDVEHHDPHYYHKYTAEFTWPDFVGEDKESEEEKIAGEFKQVYQDICDEMEEIGYEQIEYQQSAEAFSEACEANEYTFEADGRMRNV